MVSAAAQTRLLVKSALYPLSYGGVHRLRGAATLSTLLQIKFRVPSP